VAHDVLGIKDSSIQIFLRKHKGKYLSENQYTKERIILIWNLKSKLEPYEIHLSQSKNQWQAVVNTVMNHQFYKTRRTY
jgi:hypothetical protein